MGKLKFPYTPVIIRLRQETPYYIENLLRYLKSDETRKRQLGD